MEIWMFRNILSVAREENMIRTADLQLSLPGPDILPVRIHSVIKQPEYLLLYLIFHTVLIFPSVLIRRKARIP